MKTGDAKLWVYRENTRYDCQVAEEFLVEEKIRRGLEPFPGLLLFRKVRLKPKVHLILIPVICAGLLLSGLFSPGETGYAQSPASLNLGTTIIPEGDDFATLQLGRPWNLNGSPYPDYFTTLKNIDQSQFQITPNGFWDMHSTNNDARIWMLWTGVENTQRVLRQGDSIPIDASRYKLLSYYMCLDQAPSPQPGLHEDWGANIYWMYDRSPHVSPSNGVSNYLLFKQQGRFKNNGDCELITFDLSQPGTWATGSWNNSPNRPQGIRLDPINQPNKDFRIGWIRLTSVDTTNVVPLQWTNAPVGPVQFFLSQTACGQDGIRIGVADNPNGSGTFQWGAQLQPGFSASHPLPIPESFEPGDYHVYLKDSAGQISCAPSTLSIHPSPILEFQKPSLYSGPDYATTEANDPWGMASSSDIEDVSGLTNLSFSKGIMSAVSLNNDPQVIFNVPASIDTSLYRYVTLRMKINTPNTLGDDLVQRFVWWRLGAGVDSVTTEDMELYEGWQTYSIDLKTAPTENCSSNCWSGAPTSFRVDPHESWNSHRIEIDFMTLTGTDTVERGNPHTIHYTLPNAPGASVTLYYDTDRNPNNGRTPLTQYFQAPAYSEGPLSATNIFLPLLFTAREISLFDSSLSFTWDTASAAINTYYISADVDDSVVVTTWYSDVPVIVK